LGSPNQNSKTGLNCLHKLYTIKSVSNAPVEYGKFGFIEDGPFLSLLLEGLYPSLFFEMLSIGKAHVDE